MTDKNPDELDVTTALGAGDLFIVELDPDTASAHTKGILVLSALGYTQPERWKIVPSISSNNLVFAIKDINGSDASADNVIPIRVGDTLYGLSAAVSLTLLAGVNWFNSGSSELAAQDVDYFVYAIAETGAAAGIKFGFARIPYGNTMGDFSSTMTNENYLSTNATNKNASDHVRVIGRFRARLSAGAGYTWSISTSKVINYPIYETDWLSWTRVYTGFSSNPSHNNSRYKVVGDNCFAYLPASTLGTSNATTLTVTFPFAFPVANSFIAFTESYDAGAHQAGVGHLSVASGSNVGTLYKSIFQGAWTNSLSKSFNIPQFSYPLR